MRDQVGPLLAEGGAAVAHRSYRVPAFHKQRTFFEKLGLHVAAACIAGEFIVVALLVPWCRLSCRLDYWRGALFCAPEAKHR